MSLFHEGVKNILKDVLKFLRTDLQKEKLGAESKKRTQQIISEIEKFNKEQAPQWDLSATAEPSTGASTGGESGELYTDPDDDGSLNSPKTPTRDEDIDTGDNVPDISPGSLVKPEISGWLHKVRKKEVVFRPSTQKRWCAIQNGIFYYFENEKKKKQAGGFYLKDYQARHMHGDGKKLEFLFSLQCPGKREYQFIAMSDEEQKKWLEAINGEPYGPTSPVQKQPAPQVEVGGEDYEDVDKDNGNDEAEAIDEDVYEAVDEAVQPPPKSPAAPIAVLPPRGEKPSGASRGPPPSVPPGGSPGKPAQAKPVPEPAETDQEIYDDIAGEDEIYDDCASPDPPPNKSALHAGSTPSSNTTPKPSPNKSSGLHPAKTIPQPPCVLDNDGETKYDKLFYGLYDCSADANTELSFRRGDIIKILSKEFEHHKWWVGELEGKVGIVPMSYLTPAYEMVK